MQISRIILVGFLTVSLLSLVFNSLEVNAINDCVIASTTSCLFGYYEMFSMYDSSNAHISSFLANASIPSRLCCNYNGTAPYWTNSYCSHGSILSPWALDNTHIAQNKSASGAPYNICATSYDGFVNCEYQNSGSGCTGVSRSCIGSIDIFSRSNSHFGSCNELGTNICCSFNETIMLQGIQIAQFEYWCGAPDGVCPEDFRNSTGGAPICAPREDPDC